jgi:rhamnogalacturonan acetylesterase
MKLFYLPLPALLAAIAVAAPSEEISKRATPNVYLAGDSTMALGGGGTGTQGSSTYCTP